jgi:WD40 repeat protein
VVGVVGEGGGFNMTTARFSPDGRLVATAGAFEFTELGTGRLKIWDWGRGVVLSRISTDAFSVDFDPSGSRIAVADLAGRAEIWDVESGTRLSVLAGNTGGINDVVFSPDGPRVATAGFDGTVRLFDASTGTQQVVLRGHRCGVQSVAFSPDGRKLASVSACDGVRIWAIDIDDLLGIARQQVKRSLTDEECRRYLHEARCPQA